MPSDIQTFPNVSFFVTSLARKFAPLTKFPTRRSREFLRASREFEIPSRERAARGHAEHGFVEMQVRLRWTIIASRYGGSLAAIRR